MDTDAETADTPEMRAWWLLFPLVGITLTDRQPDLARPLFGDATLLTIDQFGILERQVRRRRGRAPGFLDFARLGSMEPEFTTYLAVCRRGPDTATDDDTVYDRLVADAKERADQVVAALAVMLFAQRPDGATWSLLERTYRRRQFITILELEDGLVGSSGSGADYARTLGRRAVVALSRRDLRAWRREPRLRAVWDAVLTRSAALPRSLRTAVAQACVRLADAFTSPTLPAQLLGSVTALEVLLTYTSQGTGFEGIAQRAAALLGITWTERLQLKAVLQARHRYVHQGERIQDDDLVLHALVLATAAILVYAQGMTAFRDKNALLAYLDIVASARVLQDADGQRQLVQIRPVFLPIPDDLPMLALLTKVRATTVRFYRD